MFNDRVLPFGVGLLSGLVISWCVCAGALAAENARHAAKLRGITASHAAEKLILQQQASAIMHQVLSAPGYDFKDLPDGSVELVPLTSAENADWIPPPVWLRGK